MMIPEPTPVEMNHVYFSGKSKEIEDLLRWIDRNGVEVFYDVKEHFYSEVKSNIKKMATRDVMAFIELYQGWNISAREVPFPFFVSTEELSLLILNFGDKFTHKGSKLFEAEPWVKLA